MSKRKAEETDNDEKAKRGKLEETAALGVMTLEPANRSDIELVFAFEEAAFRVKTHTLDLAREVPVLAAAMEGMAKDQTTLELAQHPFLSRQDVVIFIECVLHKEWLAECGSHAFVRLLKALDYYGSTVQLEKGLTALRDKGRYHAEYLLMTLEQRLDLAQRFHQSWIVEAAARWALERGEFEQPADRLKLFAPEWRAILSRSKTRLACLEKVEEVLRLSVANASQVCASSPGPCMLDHPHVLDAANPYRMSRVHFNKPTRVILLNVHRACMGIAIQPLLAAESSDSSSSEG